MRTNRPFGPGARAALFLTDVWIGALLGVALVGLASSVLLGVAWTVNDSGVPRWIACAATGLLVAVSCWIRLSGKISSRTLSLFWALGAACFSRPGLVAIGFDWRLEPLVILAAFGLGALAVKFPKPRRRAIAMAASCLSAVIAFGAISVPGSGVVLYVSAYIGVAACAAAAVIANKLKWRSA